MRWTTVIHSIARSRVNTYPFSDYDRLAALLEIQLETIVIKCLSNMTPRNPVGRSLFGNEIRMCLCDYLPMWSELLLSIVLGRE